MTDDDNESGRGVGKSAKEKREARLKLALRENLKRRKFQARERSDFTPASPDCDDDAAVGTAKRTPAK